MVLTVPANTLNALANASANGLVVRDFVFIKALNTETDVVEEIGLWSGDVPVTAPVIRPSDGEEEVRVFQGVAGLMQVPAIPMTMKMEVRSIKLTFSNLSPYVINAVMVYNPKSRPIQIHRGVFDPQTMNLVDPAHCRFDGFINRVQIKRAKAGNDGIVSIECQSHARQLAMGKADKFSDEFFKRRGARQKHLDVVPNIVWGQKDLVKESNGFNNGRWIKGK